MWYENKGLLNLLWNCVCYRAETQFEITQIQILNFVTNG